MDILRLVDKIIGKFILTKNNLQREKKFHENRKCSSETKDIIESILHDMSIIDAKSSALITHISVIIAALVFFCEFSTG